MQERKRDYEAKKARISLAPAKKNNANSHDYVFF
jgi:hypothetical protein